MVSHPTIPTFGGVVTRAETYTKLMWHLECCQELTAVISHLHNTEDNDADRLFAKAWLEASEQFKRLQHTFRQLAMRRMQ